MMAATTQAFDQVLYLAQGNIIIVHGELAEPKCDGC